MLRCKFNTRDQRSDEIVDQYVTELRRLANDCPYEELLEEIIRDRIVIANDFNKYFCSIGKNTVKKINLMAEEFNCDLNQTKFVPRTFPPSEQFAFNVVSQEEVRQIIIAMPTAQALGDDKISLRVIKVAFHTFYRS